MSFDLFIFIPVVAVGINPLPEDCGSYSHDGCTRRDFTASPLNKYLKDKADYTVPQGGLAFWIEPKKKVNWLAVSEKMMKKGVSLTVPDYYAGDPSIIGMRMGFGSLSEEDLQTGIKALSGCLF
ncbi:MAG TPA: hypothetical protein VIR29_04400 [Anseongella sp.]